ncbi:circadian associated repressor of transcription a [Nematolebias whitei]|uniref:circadian associated repressor of transcription a n=1 Tax=Nematolebias whitei TaxID=451745 RepID=UPI00189A3086|nr:circadian associated repressor of transcription a [Nematolebias whitei]
MTSLGKSSKWPSYDSLPSTSSFLLSESEQTEDEADVFSEGEGDAGLRRPSSTDDGVAQRSENYLHIPHRQLHSRFSGHQPKLCSDKHRRPHAACLPGAASLSTSSSTPGDLAFAQKCADLRRFICPLLELLHGLKTGRFEKGLTRFQQTVAIDRLQRILGMLQKPEMGEKYLQSLLQIELLLKSWFPLETTRSTNVSEQTTAPTLGPHRRHNQLHIPVKKRKLSWSAPDLADGVPAKHIHHQHAAASLDTASTRLPPSPESPAAPEGDAVKLTPDDCAPGPQVTDGTGPLSRSPRLCSRRDCEDRKPAEIPPSCRSSLATQDCSVSSSNGITTSDSL